MRLDLRRFLTLGLLATIIGGPLSACSGATKTTAAGGLDDSAQSLAAGGIAVVADVDTRTPVTALSGPASAMVFTRWQLQNMVAEANAHSGYLGRELDALATPPPGGPSFSAMLAAWIAKPHGALAAYAARLMSGQDLQTPATSVFPTIVVLTFIGDIARTTPGTSFVRPRSFDVERLIAAPAEADGECTALSGFVSNIVSNVASAIQSNGSSWLSTAWNELVTAGAVVATVVQNNLVKPMLAFITRIATICATIMQVSSMFKPWSVSLAGNPAAITLSDTAQSGAFVATLHAQDVKWPTQLVECVAALAPGTNLENASYKDARITWTQAVGIPGLVTKVSEDDTMPDTKTAQYTYSTITVPAVPANLCPVLKTSNIGITVTVERSDVTKTLQSLESLITSSLPQALQSFLEPPINDAIDAATSSTAKLRAPHQSIVVPVNEYFADPLPTCVTPPPPSPDPSPTTTAAAVSGTMPFIPCAQLLTDADTVPYLSGARLVPRSKAADEATTVMEGLTGINGPQSETYDHTRSTYCLLGTGTMPSGFHQTDSDGNPINESAGDFKFAAFFYTVPRGSVPMPEMTPLPASLAADPTSCNAIVGIATLNRLHAQCVVDSDTTVMIDGPEAEYAITGTPAGPPSNPEFLPLPPGGVQRAMAHILQRL
jgi:hypothetical protein